MTQASAPIGLFYGSSTCYTEMAGEKIIERINELLNRSDAVQRFNIADEPPSSMARFDYLILGMPTWDYGELQEDWEAVWDELDDLNLEGTKVALYGLGDQIGYPEWFLDAMGYLHSKVVNCGASPHGYWPVSGYEFEASQALSEDGQAFVGLALDDENEFEQSPERIERWCEQVLSEFGLLPLS